MHVYNVMLHFHEPGTQGENINSISHRSGARIKILPSAEKANERKVQFLGTKEQIKLAKDLIENAVSYLWRMFP